MPHVAVKHINTDPPASSVATCVWLDDQQTRTCGVCSSLRVFVCECMRATLRLDDAACMRTHAGTMLHTHTPQTNNLKLLHIQWHLHTVAHSHVRGQPTKYKPRGPGFIAVSVGEPINTTKIKSRCFSSMYFFIIPPLVTNLNLSLYWYSWFKFLPPRPPPLCWMCHAHLIQVSTSSIASLSKCKVCVALIFGCVY